MSVTRILFAAAAAATLISTAIAIAAEPRPDCGWYDDNGKMVFLGTCPHENGESSETPVETAPAPA